MPQITDTTVQAVQDDAGRLRLSSVATFSGDAASQRVSAVQDGAAALNVSAKSNDAALLRVSAMLFPDTTGGLTVFRSLNLSASQAVKATAGSIYGWYAWNHDNVQQYIKFYNTSGAINVGTDVPVMTVKMNISGNSETSWPLGLKGFTNGIGIAAVSGEGDDVTAVSPASAVGINLYYK